MFIFWMSYLKMASILLRFVRALIEADWTAHLYCIKDMLPHFHAYVCINQLPLNSPFALNWHYFLKRIQWLTSNWRICCQPQRFSLFLHASVTLASFETKHKSGYENQFTNCGIQPESCRTAALGTDCSPKVWHDPQGQTAGSYCPGKTRAERKMALCRFERKSGCIVGLWTAWLMGESFRNVRFLVMNCCIAQRLLRIAPGSLS